MEQEVEMPKSIRATPGGTRILARTVAGGVLGGLGLEAITIGSQRWFAGSALTFGAGAALLLLGLALATPALCRVAASVCLWPLRAVAPVEARLASSAVWRSTRRTAATATAVLAATTLAAAVITVGRSTVAGEAKPALTAVAWLSLLLAALVVASTVATMTLQRTREFGRLRVAGMQRAAIIGVASLETLPVALLGTVAGTTTGVGLAQALQVYELGLRDANFTAPWSLLVLVAIGAVVLAVAAAALSALRATRAPALVAAHAA